MQESKSLPYRLAIAQYVGWVMRVELTTSRATIWRSNQLSYTHPFGAPIRTRTPETYCLEGSCSIQLSYGRK